MLSGSVEGQLQDNGDTVVFKKLLVVSLSGVNHQFSEFDWFA